MKLRVFVIMLAILCSALLSAQNAKKGFKKIEKQEFLAAEDIFNKVLAETPEDALAQFGLAVLYADSLFPKNDYFTAYRYVNWSKDNFLKMDTNECKKIAEDITLEKINVHAIYIDKMVYKQIKEQKDQALIKLYITDFKGAGHYNDVILIRNAVEFEKAKAVNTLDAYNDFIRKFPDAVEIPDVILLRNQLAFIKAKELNTLESINQFINDYPDAEEVPQAIAIKQRMAFNLALEANTISAFEDYIIKYPSSTFIAQAKEHRNEIAFDQTLQINSIIAYNEFIGKYPEAKQVADAKKMIEALLPWTCIPGFRVGFIDFNTSLSNLTDSFGIENIKSDTLILENGTKLPGTYLFPANQEKKIFITWKDKKNFKNPSSIFIYGEKWLTNRGVRIGMSLEKLVELNGKDFIIAGFSQEGEGNVLNWNEGELTLIHKIGDKFRLRLSYNKDNIYKVSEQGLIELTKSAEISSDNSNLKNLSMKVANMVILFP